MEVLKGWKRSNPKISVIHIVRDGRAVALGIIAARFEPKTTYRTAKR